MRTNSFKAIAMPTALMASVSLAAIATPALAQTAGSQPAAATEGAAQGGLEEIVVTARKRDESVQNTPVAIAAYSPVQIQRMDLNTIERVSTMTPNLTVGKAASGTGAQITLRGIGSPATAVGVESSTAIILDGIGYANGRILSEGLFDLARIEVLKGPQALFFGKNATAGAISITSADPTPDFQASTKLGYEFHGKTPYFEQVVSSPLSDTLGIRVAARGSMMFGSLTKNLATPVTYTITDIAGGPSQTVTAPAAKAGPDERYLLGRLTLKWTPTDRITNKFKLSGTYDHQTDAAWNNLVYSCPNGVTQLSGNAPCGRNFTYYHNAIAPQIGSSYPLVGNSGDLFYKYWSYQATNSFEYRFDNVTLTSLTNWQKQRDSYAVDGDYQQQTTQVAVSTNEGLRAFSEELRLQTSFDFPLNVMVGMLYQRAKVDFAQYTLYGNVANSAVTDPSTEYLSWTRHSYTNGRTLSPFGQVIWKVVPNLEITAGARYTDEVKKSFFQMDYVRPGTNYNKTPINARQQFRNWSPEITFAYHPTSRVMIYGGYKTGYKSGGFSNSSIYTGSSSPADFQFDPEKAKGFEGGVKSTLFDNQLRLDLGLYTYKYSNLQIDFFAAQSFRYITTNAGSARTKGVEFSTEFAPRSVPGLTLRGSLNYNDARYLSFIAPCVNGQTPAQGCNTVSPYGGPGQDLSGHVTAMAPRWTGSLGGNYETDVGSGLRAGLVADARYSDQYNASAFGNPIAIQPKYVNLDATIYLRSANWEVSLIGKNLTNQFVVTGGTDSPATGSGTGTSTGRLSDQRGYVNPPRTVSLQFVYHY